MIRRRPAALLALAAALATACSSGGVDVGLPEQTPTPAEAAPTASPTPAPSPTPVPDPPGRAELPDDLLLEPGPRIAVQTAAGQILTVLGDGSNPVPLTNPAEGRRNQLPTWSRDSNRLAWIAADEATGATGVRAARFDGSAWFEVDVEREPLHLAWDPSSTQVAALAPGRNGMFELGVVDIDRGLGYRAIDEGAPYWFSWSPDGDGFLVHASTLRLDFVPVEGPSQVLEPFPGQFQAPRWLDGAVELVYADQSEGQEFLVVAGTDGAGRRALVTYDGYLQFVVAPASGLVALQVIDPALAPLPEAITASYAQSDDFADVIDPIPRDQLTVIALFGGEPFLVYPDPADFQPRPVRAFYWSPDGSRLAWLVELDPGDGDCASETATYEWQFWTGNAFSEGPRFNPTGVFACDYVPLFDQIAQSVTFWSPDGTRIAYAGTDPLTGERGIWTVGVGSNERPTLISEGEIGIWSPDLAGSAGQSAL